MRTAVAIGILIVFLILILALVPTIQQNEERQNKINQAQSASAQFMSELSRMDTPPNQVTTTYTFCMVSTTLYLGSAITRTDSIDCSLMQIASCTTSTGQPMLNEQVVDVYCYSQSNQSPSQTTTQNTTSNQTCTTSTEETSPTQILIIHC